MYSILFFCLKIQMARWSGRPGPGVLTEEAEEGMFCFKICWKLTFYMLSLSFPLTLLWLLVQFQWKLGGDAQPDMNNNFSTEVWMFMSLYARQRS